MIGVFILDGWLGFSPLNYQFIQFVRFYQLGYFTIYLNW